MSDIGSTPLATTVTSSSNEKKELKDIPIGIRAEEALKKAVANAIADHKRFGDSIVIWRDGKVVKIPADQIEIREDQAEYKTK